MALFHLTSKIHSKVAKNGSEKSITAVVAYRHCFAFDEFDYTKKSGLVDSFLMIPQNIIEQTLQGKGMEIFPDEVKAELKAKFEAGNVRNLWKAIEAKEKRKDAQLCQEIEVSLQHELSLEENIQNLKTLINNHFIRKGLCADVCIHNSKSGDNLHAHILITQRPLESIELDLNTMEPIYKFGNKLRDQEFFKAGAKVDQITPVREEWANLCNISFEKAGIAERISHKTLEAQREEALANGDFIKAAELDREPVKHIYRSESILAQHEREIAAEKAEIHNEKEQKRYKLELDLVKSGLVDKDFVVEEPVFKPVLKSFQDFLVFRKQERLRVIEENVTRYIKNRANQFAGQLRKVRARTEEVAEAVRSVVRNQRQRMAAKISHYNNQRTGKVYSGVDFNKQEQSAELRYSEQHKLNNQIEKAIRILEEGKEQHKIDKILNFVATSPDSTMKELKPLIEKVNEYKAKVKLDMEVSNKIDDKLRMKPKLWFDPYQRPELKPSWAK